MKFENYQFKKGRSGNPNGRPKGSRNRSKILMELLELPTNETDPNTGKKWTVLEKMTLAIITKAMEGNVSAYNSIMDNAFGKLKDREEEEVSEDNPIRQLSLEELKAIARKRLNN